MKCEFLINAVGCIDGALIDETENYRPKRKTPAWIWAAASAACLCVVVMLSVFSGTANLDFGLVSICYFGEGKQEYVDYRERAETGKVLITDELENVMNEHKKENVVHMVRITDANGAGRSDISLHCLIPLGKSDDERKNFIQDGIIALSRKEILSIKGTPQMALIISPAMIAIGEEYLNTVGKDTLDVWVTLDLDNDAIREFNYLDEYDRLDIEARIKLIEGEISRFFEKKYSADVEIDDEFREFLKEYDWLDTETRHGDFVKEISRFFYEKYTELGVDGDPIRGYKETLGHVDLTTDFELFLREERLYGLFKNYAEDNGIDVDNIKEYRETSATFNAELDVELIKRLLQDERTRSVFVTGV